MKQVLILIILTASLNSFGQEFDFDYHKDYKKVLAQTNDTSSHLNYNKLLKRFQKNDTTLTDFEVLALLIGFTDNEHYKPYSYLTTEREIYSLNGKGKYEKALSMCDSFLVNVPVSQQALIEKSYSYHKLGHADSAQYYMWQFRRIMKAMAQSGDGLTPETAFFSLGPADGQNFIIKYLSSDIGSMGSGRDKYGNSVDILETTWKDKESGEQKSRVLYFQIEHASKTMFEDLNFENPDQKEKKKKRK